MTMAEETASKRTRVAASAEWDALIGVSVVPVEVDMAKCNKGASQGGFGDASGEVLTEKGVD